MNPEISEFSYGFALTNELVAWAPLKLAPVFPSLVAEGKHGGGWDLKLDWPGVPLYLQFKRSFRMTRRSAVEISKHGVSLTIPFHRFHVTDTGTSAQRLMLLELDDGINQVYYAAPRFDRLAEINDAWTAKAVADRSLFVTPATIGELDDEPHHVAFDATRNYLCSKPRPLEGLSAAQVVERVKTRLTVDDRPLKETVSEYLVRTDAALARAQIRIEQRKLHGALIPSLAWDGDEVLKTSSPALPSAGLVPWRMAEGVSDAERKLTELADKVYRTVGLQLVIAQPTAKGK